MPPAQLLPGSEAFQHDRLYAHPRCPYPLLTRDIVHIPLSHAHTHTHTDTDPCPLHYLPLLPSSLPLMSQSLSLPYFTISGPASTALPSCPPLLQSLLALPSSRVSLSSYFSCLVTVPLPALPFAGLPPTTLQLPLVLVLSLCFSFFVYSFESMLSLRQIKCYGRKSPDERLKKVIGTVEEKQQCKEKDATTTTTVPNFAEQFDAKFSKAQSYGLDKLNFSLIHSSYEILFDTLLLSVMGYLPYMWSVSERVYTVASAHVPSRYLPAVRSGPEEILVSVVFFTLTALVTEVFLSTPWALYQQFVVEEKHGFNKMTAKLFVTDKVKSVLLTVLLGSPILALVLAFLKFTGPNFVIYTWILTFFLCIFAMTIVPVYIMPLFNKFEPLPDGRLREQICALAATLKFPLTKLFVVDGSKRSSHSNAYLFGFGKNKRIVLFDTLLKQVSDDEVLAILGHELGHWALWHTATNFVVTQVYLAVLFTCFAAATTSDVVPKAFGFDMGATSRPVPTFISLLMFLSVLWPPVDKAVSLLLTLNSRRAEFQADAFSVDMGRGVKLGSALATIHLENLGNMCPDWAYSQYHFSHPPLVERLQAIYARDGKRVKKGN